MGRLSRFRYVRLAGFGEDEYELYGLDGLSRREARRFLSAAQMHNVVRPALNNHRYNVVLDDKWLFAHIFHSAGIQMPATVGLIHPDWGMTWEGDPLRSGPDLAAAIRAGSASELVVKPVAGRQGRGLLMVNVEIEADEVRIRTDDGRSLTFQDLVDTLSFEGFDGLSGFVVQERVHAHPAVAELNPEALNSLRVHTFRRADGSVDLHSALLRLGRRGQRLEAIGGGSIAILVDPETGLLGRGIVRPKFGGGTFDAHPDTGVRFRGRALPFWRETVELCMRAARVVPALRILGWDVAITPTGPVVLEGNSDWNPLNAQSHGRGYLSDEMRRELALAGSSRPDADPNLSMLALRLRRRLGRLALARVYRWSGLHPRADRRI